MKVKIIIMLMILSLFTFGIGLSYMQFHSEGTGIVNQKVASFIFNVDKVDSIEIPMENLKPGDNLEYKFSVTNTDEEKTSNVTIEYKITLKTYHLAPLNINLFKIEDGVETNVLTCDETFGRDDENQVICNTEVQELLHNSEKMDDYVLKIEFPEEYNDSKYSNLVDFIDIEITSNQKL